MPTPPRLITVLPWLAAWYALASLACLVVYARDKRAAIRQQRRTPERTLLLLGLAGGWPGALLAQHWLRHKSSKTSFLAWFWLTVAANLSALIWLGQAIE